MNLQIEMVQLIIVNQYLKKNTMSYGKKRTKNNEETLFKETLSETLKAKKAELRYFAEEKLKAYENAEVLKSGVRVYKHNDQKGVMPQKEQEITVRYVGYVANGSIFDSGVISYTHGVGEVIVAWEQAFKQIKEGEKATIIAPSSAAYGKYGAGKQIKPFTTLIFDVTLEKIGS